MFTKTIKFVTVCTNKCVLLVKNIEDADPVYQGTRNTINGRILLL